MNSVKKLDDVIDDIMIICALLSIVMSGLQKDIQ